MQALDARERELRGSITQLQDRAERLDRESRALHAGLTPSPPPTFDDLDAEGRRAWLNLDAERRSTSPGVPTRTHPFEWIQSASSRRQSTSRARLNRPQSRDGLAARRSTLLTPPNDECDDSESLFLPESDAELRRRSRRSHPLSRSWRPDSPVNGLGDRNRSPTPQDGWEIMRTTIAPDANLPSADSSFTSSAASHSFASNDTSITEPDLVASSLLSRRNTAGGDRSDSGSSVGDPDDLASNGDERELAFAHDMYFHELRSGEGRSRIEYHEQAHRRNGNVYVSRSQPEHLEIGFRLIHEALDSPEGRERVFQLSQNRPNDSRDFEDWLFASRRDRRRSRRAHASITDDIPPRPRLEHTRSAVREATDQVHDYFRRFTADALVSEPRHRTPIPGPTSPSPRYEPLASHPDVNAFTSRDEPEPHPVSPPSTRVARDVGDALLSGDDQDSDSVRRIVQRLADTDEVPDEWWMSVGLNASRTGVRSQSPVRRSHLGASGRISAEPLSASSRVRTGRIERGNSRL